ncbi:phosphatase PAP2 family protein [Nocardioides sp.]|uniref:phosphatase PAP2 family protein n=1 Tax=Nocardioides sp. TaxID=35761 RepID=UPI0037846648
MSADEQVRPLPERTGRTGRTSERRDTSPADGTRRDAVRLTIVLWSMAAVFGAVTLARSELVDIPLRDPSGRMFSGRLTSAFTLLLVLVLVDAIVRALRRQPSVAGLVRGLLPALRERWTLRRSFLVVSGLVGYHVIYVCYRNLKSWDAFNTPRDEQLSDFDRILFLGHSPAGVLHSLLGTDQAAVVLAFFYESFVYVVVAAVVGSLALLPRIKDGYVMLLAGAWVWILGVGSYYLIPSLGPFASAPAEFAKLRPTGVSASQADYLVDRAHLLADPSAPDAFASISAFASLHTAFTCAILLVALHLRLRLVAAVLACYLVTVLLATVYFGMHFVVDDIAGVAIAVVAVLLARLTVHWPRVDRDDGR